jgi:hypothetical protein
MSSPEARYTSGDMLAEGSRDIMIPYYENIAAS